MNPENFENMSKVSLIRELKKIQEAHRRSVSDLDAADPKRVMYNLEIHQIELEMQNRELRESQERLEDAQARYSDLYNFAPVGYCTLDPEGYIQEINLTGSTMLETPRERLIGQSFRTVAARDNPLQFQAHMKRCREEKDRVTGDLTLVLKKGGRRTLRMISEPVINPSGVRTAYRMALIDVTEEKRFEEELQLLSNLAEVSNSPLQHSEPLEVAARVLVPAFADLLEIDLLGDEGQIERVLVVFAEPGKQKTLAESLKKYAPHPGWKTAQAKVIESGEPMLLEEVPDIVRNRMAHDETHAGILRAAGIRSMIVVPLTTWGRTFGALTFATAESGRLYSPAHFRVAQTVGNRVAIAIENVRLFAERTRAVAARDTILAVVSHDLRNPLNAIQLKAHLISKNPDSQRRRESDFIARRADEMNRLIQDLLDISSIEAGRLRLEKSRQAALRMLKEALAVWEPQAAQKSLAVDCECPGEDELDLDCDPNRILQVVNNLIGNAIKFTDPGGSIHVRVEPRADELCFSVTDSGPGIPEADLPHIFDRFTRASKGARPGTGLGLSIAKGIVEAHGGQIWAKSQAGVGSTFYFTLPRIPSSPGEPNAPRSTAGRGISAVEPVGPIQQNLLNKVVLVVDDDADCRKTVAEVLEHEGYDVVSLQNGNEALEYLRHAPRHPSCILLDLAMPVIDGWTFLRERNSNPELQTIPIIVLSGQHDVEEQVIAAHASYLPKPLSPEHLTQVMHQVVC
jgi:PAS domain S-box-containing protein